MSQSGDSEVKRGIITQLAQRADGTADRPQIQDLRRACSEQGALEGMAELDRLVRSAEATASVVVAAPTPSTNKST